MIAIFHSTEALILVLFLIAIIAAVAFAFFIISIVALPAFGIWLRTEFHKRTNQRDSLDRELPQSFGARKQVANLPWFAARIAQAGEGGQVRHSLNAKILSPTIGMRAMSGVLFGAIMVLTWSNGGQLLDADPWILFGATAAALYAFAFVQFYELHYDSQRLKSRNALFQLKEYEWGDIVGIKDNGHYLYQLTLVSGKTVEIQKYLVGIRDFLTYAQDRIAANNR